MKYCHLKQHGWILKDGSFIYYAKWNDRERQEPYDFTDLWDIKQKGTNKHTQKLQTNRYRQHNGRRRTKRVKGVQYMVLEGDYASSSEHTIEYTHVILWSCTHEI